MKVNSEIRNLKRNIVVTVKKVSEIPDVNRITENWRVLIISMQDILENGNTNICYQEIYQKINDLLMYDIPPSVTITIEEMFSIHAKNIFRFLTELITMSDCSKFFEAFNSIWRNVNNNFSLLRKILIKFEKKFFAIKYSTNVVDENVRFNSSWGCFLENLKKILICDNQFIQILIQRILNKIKLYRDQLYNIKTEQNENLREINEAIKFLWEVDLYKEHFNDKFLNDSLKYYAELSLKIFNNKPIEEYIIFVEKSFEYENNLVLTYLNEFSLKKIIQQLDSKLLLDNKKEILNKIFANNIQDKQVHILNENKIQLVKKVYLFYKKIKVEDDLKKSWLSFVHSTSSNIFQEFNRNYTIVDFFDNLVMLKRNIDLTLKEAYLTDDKFKSAAKEAFVKSLNLKPNTVADYLSRYIDHILTLSDTEENYIIKKIDEFVTIFKHIDAKDMFESFFIKRLANRLLYNLTSTTNGEKYLIEKLRSECGNVFVTKSEEMLSDIKTSADLTLNTEINFSQIKFNFYVLSTNSWPVNKIVTGHVSDDINCLHKEFLTQNKSKFGGKALKWHLPYCSGEIKYFINNKNITIEANGVQCAVLSKFTKSRSEISIKDLLKLTLIEKDDLLSCLNSLTKSFPILIYDKITDTYKLNTSFVPSKTHLIINDFASKEETSLEEIREVEERNWEDRKHVLDALIMKTLKAKKQMKIHEIIHSVLDLVKFPCEISSVNERIKSLSTGGYLVKDEKDSEMVRYS
jgi:cullin-4